MTYRIFIDGIACKAAVLCIASLGLASVSTIAFAYDKANVTNSTGFDVEVEIDYAACRSDKFTVPANTSAMPSANRGGCLITKITGTMSGAAKTPGAMTGPIAEYDSSGTGYSQFYVQSTPAGGTGYRISSEAELSTKSPAGYPKAVVTNKTGFDAQIEVDYAACHADSFTVPSGQSAFPTASRGACLITKITGTLTGDSKDGCAASGPVTTYASSGTSYSQFILQAVPAGGAAYRIWSEPEFEAAVVKSPAAASVPAPQTGVHIQNRFHPEQELNTQSGVASSPTPSDSTAGAWGAERVDAIYIRLKNQATGKYLHLVNNALAIGDTPATATDAMWEVEPVAGGLFSRLRNRSSGGYLNVETGKLAIGTIQPNWFSAMWTLKGFTGSGACRSVSQWMRANGDRIGAMPLSKLVLPGTHDSTTYAIQGTGSRPISDLFAPDTDNTKRALSATVGGIYFNWAKAQGLGVYQQLYDGIRYIDLRVCADKSGALLTCHGLYAAQLQSIFADIARFASENPREIVIVQLQHFYDWGAKTAAKQENNADYNDISTTTSASLDKMIQATLGPYLVARVAPNGSSTLTPSSTIRNVWQSERQIVLITDLDGKYNGGTQAVTNDLWPAKDVVDYEWDGTGLDRASRISKIQGHLTSGAKSPGEFLIVPFAMSPDTAGYVNIVQYPSGLHSLADQTNPVLMSYLTKEWRGLKANIISTDWYNESCLVPVALGLDGIPTSLSGCNLDRNGSWK